MSPRDTKQTQFPICMLNEAELDGVSGGFITDFILRLAGKHTTAGGGVIGLRDLAGILGELEGRAAQAQKPL